MKNTLFIIALLFSSISTHGQFCFESLSIQNQDQLDLLSSSVVLVGDLTLEGNSITNLTQLSTLSTVLGNVIIRNTTQLKDLNGLANLNFIGGDLILQKNMELKDLDGLMSLYALGGSIRIEQNPNLKKLNGLEKLTSISKSLIIFDNDKLTDLGGISDLRKIDLNLEVKHNDQLSDCCILSKLIRSGGVRSEISISNNPMTCQLVLEITNHCTANRNTDLKGKSSQGNTLIKVFPNPTEGILNVKIPSDTNEKVRLTLFDLQGRMILQNDIQIWGEEQLETLSLYELNPGMYFLNVKGETFFYTEKVSRR